LPFSLFTTTETPFYLSKKERKRGERGKGIMGGCEGLRAWELHYLKRRQGRLKGHDLEFSNKTIINLLLRE